MTLSIFQFQAEQSVRVEFQNNEPLFCLTDVARILEISNANPLRFNMKRDGVHKMYSVDTKGRKNEITYINEPNLYRVIFRSNKPEAVKFQDWIFEEVIPQIRKTGGYQVG
ncbi:Bro-N domain-containing protein, partial [Neisseria gonorrhoeae]